MASTAVDSEIHGFLFSTDEMREIWSDKNWVQKWLDTEAALAKAQGELGCYQPGYRGYMDGPSGKGIF